MKRLQYLVMFCFCVVATASFAQVNEICANSIDDDGDGFIDCFDSECSNNIVCTGGYIGNDLLCEAKPSEFPKFSLALESASENGTANHLGRAVVGDIDRDGIPEMVTVNRWSQKIFILNGENVAGVNTIQKQITVSYSPAYEDIAIANIDNDNCAEIFVLSTKWKLYSYDCNLNELWSTQLSGDPGTIGLADFNGDGKVEIYARNAIYNAHTGVVIVAPTATWANFNGGPVAVDILNDATKNAHLLTDLVKDDNLELVCGGTIFSVNIGAGTITAEKTIPNYGKKVDIDATSIADVNLDGSLDVVASGKNTADNGNTTIFFWDVVTNKVKTFADPKIYGPTDQDTLRACPRAYGKFYAKGWQNGTGRVNIADLDGDGRPDLAFVSGKYLYALKDDPANATKLVTLWPKVTVFEETSGNTGCTLFDFNGDGQSEIVYRDEKFVYIINGTNGKIFTQQPCVSRTNREYPIVADVDGDGNTELCVTCRTVDFIQNGTITNPKDPNYLVADEADFCTLPNAEFSQVRIFRSGAEPWVPARRVWNQHGYFNVNVNDNLSIPLKQQKHHLVFSENVCTVGKNRPLNGFLNQSPYLNSLGCPKYASPDLAYVQKSLIIKPPTCPNGNFTISFQITNLGDVSLSGIVPITFYDGDPTKPGASKLDTIMVSLNGFTSGSVRSITNATVKGPGSFFTLYIVLNDAGTTVPTPIKLPNTNFIECDYGNNILSAPVIPKSVGLVGLKVQDNIKCSPGTSPDNGSVRAYIPNGAAENTVDYDFYWSIGNTAKSVALADHVGPTYTGLKEDIYTVYAIHKTAICNSDTVKIDVQKVNAPIEVDIVLVNPYDNCKNPNGKLRAVINDTDGDGVGDPPANYTYTWYLGNDIFGDEIGISFDVDNLGPLTYTVLVKSKTNSCQTIESFTIPDQTLKPVSAVTQTDVLCSSAGSGSASANVGGITAGYTFEWYKGNAVKPIADFTGATYNNLAAGPYTMVATKNSSQCSANPVKITILKTVPPVVSTSIIAQQTSCDPTLPNGSASANVGGATTGFNFEWFIGQNTLLSNRVATTSTAQGLTNTIYTVKATEIATGCSATMEVTIGFAVVTPVLSLASSTNSTKCNPLDGSITIAVNPGTPADYKFSWYNGPIVKAVPDFADTIQVLSGLPAGTYTVKAFNNIRHCQTAPLKVTIIDLTPVVSFVPTNVIRPSDCNDNNGSLSIAVSAPGNVLGFDFEWRKGQAPFLNPAITTVTNTATATTASQLVTGLYTLIATNRDNGCSASQPFNLPFDDAQVLTFLSKLDIQSCVPGTDGKITVKLIPTPSYVESDYRIDIYEGTNDLGPGGTVFNSLSGIDLQSDYDLIAPLQPGFYTFVAVTANALQSTFNCRSVPVTVELKKNTTDPSFTSNPSVNNVNCMGAMSTGQLSLSIVNPADYSFDWFEGTTAASPPLGTATSGVEAGVNGEIANNLPGGKYTVVVTKVAGTSIGCSTTATYQIFDNLPVISIAQANIAITNITRCDMPTMGTASISSVTEAGSPTPVANYDFEWFASTLTGPQIIPGFTTATLTNQSAGIYYVRPINKVSKCSTSQLIEFEILDQTANTVSVDLMSFTVPTQCLKPSNIVGELEVLAAGNSGTGYTYSWYAGQTTAGPVLSGGNISGPNGEVAQNLAKGFYTVDVLNNSTQCRIAQTFELPLEIQPINMTASAAPLTVCIVSPKDGSVFATVPGGFKNDYSYSWYIRDVKAVEDFISTPLAEVTNLDVERYIVKAVDLMDAACIISDTVQVTDKRVFPVVSTQPVAPVTNCDPTRPDGVAAANVGGDVTYHSFDWFTNAPPTGVPFYNGSQVSSLAAGLYSVIGTNIISGCADTAQVTIDIKQLPVPNPKIEILSMVTSCVSNNGSLAVSVNGITRGYIFNWYIGTTEKATPDFSGEFYDSLAVGMYSVTATDAITQCKSPLVSEEIITKPQYPEFSISTVSSVCREDSSEPGTGFAALFITNGVDTDSIIWTASGSNIPIATGPILAGADAGKYDVTVITALGCSQTKTIEIKTEVRPFNGVSRNNDGQNDIFHINCIESFPANVVKIYNRIGTIVYEGKGYNNSDIVFDGQSNRGISLMGNNLPGGTYFYIIDKQDGSKPMAGYLELVN